MKTMPTPEERQFLDRVQSMPEVQQWLSKFNEDSAARFLKEYHKSRSHWISIGTRFADERNARLTQALEQADEVLTFIQQKKLFDLQCQWRADLIKVEGVRHGGDFLTLESKVMSLEFLSPIASEEVELAKDWLMDFDASRYFYPCWGWQQYKRMIEKNQLLGFAENEFPGYYNFVDARHKVVPLWRVLPDKRGEKEDHYWWKGHEAQMLKSSAEAKSPDSLDEEDRRTVTEAADERPWMSIYENHAVILAKMIEDRHTYACIDGFFNHRAAEDWELENAIRDLEHADTVQPIETDKDWKRAVKRAAHMYRHSLIVEALDAAYANYLFRRQTGIGFADSEIGRSSDMFNPEAWGEAILLGRETLGEPRDFNF